MYLPVRGGGGASSSSCPSYADTVASSLTQMAFASMVVTVFNAVANIANNINNNNRNDNINSNSNIDSNNANVASNNNNANQVNIIIPPPIPPGRSLEFKRKRQQILRLKKISEKLLELQKARDQTKSRSSRSVKKNGALSKALVRPLSETSTKSVGLTESSGRSVGLSKPEARPMPESTRRSVGLSKPVTRLMPKSSRRSTGLSKPAAKPVPKTSRKSVGSKEPVARPKTTGTIFVKQKSGVLNKAVTRPNCRSRKAYARAALNTLRAAQDILSYANIGINTGHVDHTDMNRKLTENKNEEKKNNLEMDSILKAVNLLPQKSIYKSSITRPKWQDFGNQTGRKGFNNQTNIFVSDFWRTKTFDGDRNTNTFVNQKAHKSNDTVEATLVAVCSPARHLCDSLDPQSTIDSKIVECLVQMGRWRDAVSGHRPSLVPSGTVTPGFTCLQVTAVCQS
ncbi:probable serine/threonine-protein kinase tsuA [Macrobrachium rosenbergii]|uniref:probable serine/threonine-protein kinase tsuA n=1 Tax=Macrobrachium rosenbergii TaxID=79674 RepID=UPI0034D64207